MPFGVMSCRTWLTVVPMQPCSTICNILGSSGSMVSAAVSSRSFFCTSSMATSIGERIFCKKKKKNINVTLSCPFLEWIYFEHKVGRYKTTWQPVYEFVVIEYATYLFYLNDSDPGFYIGKSLTCCEYCFPFMLFRQLPVCFTF